LQSSPETEFEMPIWKNARRWMATGLLMLAAVAPLVAEAQIRPEIRSRSGYTAGQWALLPEWCRYTQDNPVAFRAGIAWDRVPEAQKWIALIGPDMLHMHHYCRGLRYELMLTGFADLNPRERIALNENIISEMAYVINNCGPTMPLLPEVMLKKGEAHLRMNELPLAADAFEQSRRLKPDYWPAYTRWADVLINLKQFDRARALLEEGLAHVPGEPQLLERLRLAGGTPRPAQRAAAAPVAPAPAPVAQSAAPPQAAPAPAPAASTP
jgi:tetratricopeptide (TPR) repeat protein